MKKALLFRENHEPVLVSAEEVRDGMYNRYEEFVDPEYEFKVQFVKGARNNGAPYFRFYYSYEEYKKLYPGRASRYEIVADMRRYKESEWHQKWKANVSDFCSIEKCIKNSYTNKWKFADAFYNETQTCIEFQHSYIAWDFEERNKIYADLSINTIWLYDLPRANARKDKKGNIEILEDNARGFFRISENLDNLKRHCVYIQVKSGMIYRVRKLLRREISAEQKSTIRFFIPSEVYTEAQFVEAIRHNKINLSLGEDAEDTIEEDIIKNEDHIKTIQKIQDDSLPIMDQKITNDDLIDAKYNQQDKSISFNQNETEEEKVEKEFYYLDKIRKSLGNDGYKIENNSRQNSFKPSVKYIPKVEVHREKTQEEYFQEVKHLFGQHDQKIFDSRGKRWLECAWCRKKCPSAAFMEFNVDGKLNLGTCITCYHEFGPSCKY